MENDKQIWFAKRRYGYGSGLPVRWQGWAVLALYTLVLLIAIKFLAELSQLAVIVLATVALGWVCRDRTDGGWRWRWGGKP